MFELKFKLLEHPFYKAWENGQIPLNKLSEYAYSYLEFIERIPDYWKNLLDSFSVSDYWVVNEEKEHIELWKRWIKKLPKSESYPKLDELINYFNSLNPSEILGALYSFEVQQPEIAKFKKECLMKFYNFKDEDLTYFDEHMKEEKHLNVGMKIYKIANKNDFEVGFKSASELLYRSLDNFL